MLNFQETREEPLNGIKFKINTLLDIKRLKKNKRIIRYTSINS